MKKTFSNTHRNVFREQWQAILAAIRAVYWLAKEDIVTVKYDSLLNFLDEVGLEMLPTFEWEEMLPINLIKVRKVCKTLLLLFDRLVEDSPFFSLLIDESTVNACQ